MSRARLRTTVLLGTALAALPAAAQQQGPLVQSAPVTPVVASGASAAVPSAPDVFAIEQLDSLLAPIALYPDAVLAPLLMAATDPLPLVMAARWVAQPDHATLTGDALVTALADQDWDPDVKALAPFPAVLRMLDGNLGWTMQLGYAMANQPAAVLDSIQRLRRQAIATGALGDGPGFTLHRAGAAVEIDAAGDGTITVPNTDPAAAYGPWPYAAVSPTHLRAGEAAAVTVPAALRDLAGIAWTRGEVVLDVKSWNAVNGDRPPVSLAVWHPRQVYAVIGRVDASLDARPLPPSGPVGRPARPSGIPANAIGRTVVTVAADLVRRPAPQSPGVAAALHQAIITSSRPGATGAQAAALRLAPLPAHVETLKANALSDVGVGAQASVFGERGAESRSAAGATPQRQSVAGLAQ